MQVNTIQVTQEMSVGVGLDGKMYGGKLLNVNQQLDSLEREWLVVVPEALGESAEIR
ncbi:MULTISPECIES: hypothetical protein [Nostocales]|uniref:Uncharacterized protein n=2 Tax=Nostocales TaxID=1161 RepID=A0ABW8WZ22_9CYAN|nr:hypothetical protein [Tolypothrix bouteillei]